MCMSMCMFIVQYLEIYKIYVYRYDRNEAMKPATLTISGHPISCGPLASDLSSQHPYSDL